MSWLFIIVAGLFEIAFAIGLKSTHGFTRLWPTLGTGAALLASMTLLAIAVRDLPVGTAYAVWTGIGAAGTALLGIALFGDPVSMPRLAFIGCIMLGVVGLKFVSP
jgi:quaternary ammonium compound-resistance protein SugE